MFVQVEIHSNNSLLLQKFLNGDVDLRTIEQRDLKVNWSVEGWGNSFLSLAFIKWTWIEVYVVDGD